MELWENRRVDIPSAKEVMGENCDDGPGSCKQTRRIEIHEKKVLLLVEGVETEVPSTKVIQSGL